MLDEGWKLDIWQLGILILELMNGGPLSLNEDHPSG